MKTAEELFNKHSSELEAYRLSDSFMNRQQFKKALTEHDNEIKAMIDEMIKELWAQGCTPTLDEKYQHKIEALTELRDKL